MKAFIAAAIIAAIGLSFWLFGQTKTTPVDTATTIVTPAVQAVYATGTVEASRMIPVSARVAARLMKLDVDEGAKITAGQTLAQLEDTDVQENLKQLDAQLQLAQKEFERAEKLWKVKAISRTGFEQAQAELTAAQANVDRTKAELGYLQLIAPEDGTIIRRDGEIGELIPTGTTVFWMTGGNSMRIETEVDEEDIGLIQLEQNVVIRADAFPQETFEGKVQSITPKGDPVARSYRVRVSLPDNSPLLIGMTAETNIITQVKDKALMIPATALSNGNVIKIIDNKAVITHVKTGIKTPQAVEILEGVGENETVAMKFDSTLTEKGSLNPKNKDWAPDSKK